MLKKKKSSSDQAPEKMVDNPVVEDEKPASKSKKLSNEIDQIFAGKKRKKPEGKKSENSNKNETAGPKLVKKRKEKNKKSKEGTEGEFAEPPARPRKKTKDGFSIYTEEELGINKADAGSTPLCPFDCSCCF